jgi:hypothetical protein
MKRYINVGRNSKVGFCCKHSTTFQFCSIRTRRWCSLFKFYKGSMLNFRFSSSSFSHCPITLHNFIWCQWKQSHFLSIVHDSVFVTSTIVYSMSISGNVGFLAGTIALEVAYSMTTVALNIGGATD